MFDDSGQGERKDTSVLDMIVSGAVVIACTVAIILLIIFG